MYRHVKKILLAVMMSASIVGSSGCVWLAVGAAAGAGTYAWISGVMQKDYMASARDLQVATRKALRDMGLTVEQKSEERLSAVYKAAFPDGQNVSVNIEALTERSARLRIRVGMFGDEIKSEMILNAIEKGL